MQAIWTALQPHIGEALVTLLGAAITFAVAWLRARTAAVEGKTEAQRQAALAASEASEVRALYEPRMDGRAKMGAAKRDVFERLPAKMRPKSHDAERMIQDSIPEARARIRRSIHAPPIPTDIEDRTTTPETPRSRAKPPTPRK